ncbi:two-component sensor histidine kinase [Pseudomonas sp. PIC25]|uniref:sensor histidine kinase n=1 Tax=Pseudomonas sp. PIC25 TaxID=1958773 RepID=UPI000BAC0F94|nr:ATP-binding protein [Pseudomonas sp. PIC25]PAU65758.1 two-component sensor histidine kinase [Pseudomonas sp. PIC25]
MRSFDDDPRLTDLLSTDQEARLCQLIGALTGGDVSLVEQSRGDGEPLEFNLETIGWLRGDLPAERLHAAARLVEFVLMFVAKYRLAANLHNDTTEASFAELQRQHAALQASEARYKALSEQLQERVEDQVKVIEQAQQQLYETARLRAVGQLAAGVAHEINNPIGFITSNLRVAGDYLDELAEKIPGGHSASLLLDDFRALLRESLSGTQRIARIVADLKTFSNIDQADFIPCDLNALLTTSCHLLQAESQQAIDVQLDLAPLPKLAGYPAKLSQAFFNVLDNAAKAIDAEGVIRVSSRQVDGVIEVTIEDNGPGIPPDVQERIFDPFFTTRAVGSGTGLGLSVARDIMRAHRGEILLDSQVGAGTRVTLRFNCPNTP